MKQKFIREFLIHILNSDPEIKIVGVAGNGEEALEAVKHLKPDVITMDMNMPKMNGMEATRRIMESQPVPIIIVSGSWDKKEVETTFKAIEAGALAMIQKPLGISHPDHASSARDFVRTVKLMSEVRVVRRWPRYSQNRQKTDVPVLEKKEILQYTDNIKLIAVGASTGGPPALHTILSNLPKIFPVPVMIVQHIAAGFINGLVEWLAHSSKLPVHVASQNENIRPGHVYIAPDGFHMGIENGARVWLSAGEPENGMRPSVSFLFRSAADFYGKNAAGILLSGMGKDGAKELKIMKDMGCMTMVQDRESSPVYGMPGAAIECDAANYVLPPEGIAHALAGMVSPGQPEYEIL